MNKTSKKKKGAIQVDFVVAASLFILTFIMVVQLITNFFTTSENTAEINVLADDANLLLGVADFAHEPSGWNGSGSVDRIGFSTRAYRFYIVADNSQPFYLNQSQGVADLNNELVSFTYSGAGFTNVDVNSTEIYVDGASVPYNVNGDNITFRVDVGANAAKTATVYFDDDSNFTSESVGIDGNNNITETVHFVHSVQVMQYRKFQALNASNYTDVRDSLGLNDFSIKIEDADTKQQFFSYGGEAPRSGNIIALQRNHVFQNSTAGIRSGVLTVKAW